MPRETKISDQEILDQFDRDDIDRKAYTYGEIAENIDGVTTEYIRQRLWQLKEEGKVETKVIGNSVLVLWHLPGTIVFACNLPENQ